MKKLLITGAFGSAAEQMAEYSVPTFKAYAKRHGYGFKMINRYTDQHPAWQKVFAFQDYLQTYDLVFWIDIDAIIVKQDRDIADVFNYAKGFQAIPCEPDEPNTGVWVMRNTVLAHKFIDYIIDLSPDYPSPCYEQEVVREVLGYDSYNANLNYVRETILLPEKWNNIHGNVPESEEIIRHFAGRTDAKKIEGLRKVSERLNPVRDENAANWVWVNG